MCIGIVPEPSASQAPTGIAASGEQAQERASLRSFETVLKPDLFCVHINKLALRAVQQSRACPIYQTKAPVAIKRKNSDINFRHHSSQKGGRLSGLLLALKK